ncbi:hypothetical protein L1987_14758 [Smallanthus sonchifolius]|uniref:Uncharacterized protein n=1 Tax=Smallanthus sonchifolius TaxID=185202 RepID=A0ACB9J4Q4_9ASTR|nr:hypothetical protein L1987_14758 [Smallanthus sonchifolius]
MLKTRKNFKFVSHVGLCKAGSLDPKKAKGKLLVCLQGDNARVDKGQEAALAGAVGMVLANNNVSGNEIIADPHVFPATHITYTDGLAVYHYLNSTKTPMAYITHPSTQLDTKPAPFMAAFSSKGPNIITPEILKPDITAPGVSIIAAYTESQGPTNQDFDTCRVQYNCVSGTSMSCPHVSARTRDNVVKPMTNASHVKATPLSYGAGHVQPNRAMDPGLVYDLTTTDYLDLLCALGYTKSQVKKFSETPYACPSKNISLIDLNYPSITVPNLNGSITVIQTLKNVGSPATYVSKVFKPAGVSVLVQPKRLKFKKIGEVKMFKVTLKSKKGRAGGDYVFGQLKWSDGKHNVRSPIVVRTI